jgi:hypothetical protein
VTEPLGLDVLPVELRRLVTRGQPSDHPGHHLGGCPHVGDAELGHVLPDALGGDETGLHVVATDPLVGQLDGQEAGDALERPLRDPVPHAPSALARRLGGVAVSRGGRDIHDDPAAVGDHGGQDQTVEHQGRHDVGLELALQQFDGRVEKAVHVPGPDVAPVVHDEINATPPLQHGGHGRTERGLVEEVGRHGQRFLPFLGDQRGGFGQAPGQR